MRDTIIFSGASNTFGLGLEIELRDKYNDDDWLKENGMYIPNPREPEDIPFWKEYRWSKLVSDELGMVEHNIHDEFSNESHPMGGNSIETLWFLNRDNDTLKTVLDRTKYIILEMGAIRWWDEKLHGLGNPNDYPNTVLEIIDLINNKDSSPITVAKALDWIKDLDEKIYWDTAFKKYKNLKELHPEIEFIMIPWAAQIPFKNDIANDFLNDIVDVGKYCGIFQYLIQNRLRIGDVATAYNGNYKYNTKDDHPSKLGHRHVANFVINHINKNNNLETIPFDKNKIKYK
jgi:hypothetical protein